MGQLQSLSHTLLQNQGILSSSRAPKQQISRFSFLKEPILLEQHCLGSAPGFLVFLHQWSSTYNCLTTTEIRAVKQNISSHCWQLCPSNSSRHSLDELGLKINSALPVSPQKGWALGAWLGRSIIWITNQAEDWCCGHPEHHFPQAITGRKAYQHLCPTDGSWCDEWSTTHPLHKHPHPPLHPQQPPLHDGSPGLCKEVAASWEVEPHIFSDGFKDKELHVL